MSRKHREIFEAICSRPDRKDIRWDDFTRLMEFLGAEGFTQGGSAHGFRLNDMYSVFHKPHPGNEIYPTDLKRIRRFLKEAGIEKVE